ncbi:MAG: tRNA (adenosine(37)-N6)-threonylcarbamoyltransferase complex transferase subunit TsaD [Oscillospiraceae bacterium]|nr:tRNA (adenosine(37)-N6)-threonylcarbamoyltransferase complex transferase subunit TsaD [Oscillospiraceae bacterium]
MLILSIESSCDETSAAVTDCRTVRSNIIASQTDIHRVYGGVVPEIASRAHTEAISRITYESLREADITMNDINAVAVTYTPGLIGALLVGVNFAKALAFAHSKPLVAVDHILGHVASNYISHAGLEPPFTAFVVSGGHTSLIEMTSYTEYTVLGRTRDDAMGEAFDKVARVMGLPYPGGVEMDRLAALGDPYAIKFPSAALNDGTNDFSFSGLKTAVINYIHNIEQKGQTYSREDVAASFTKTVTDSIIKRLDGLCVEKLAVAGGVSANSHIRKALERYENVYMPPLNLCGDNAAMIGVQAYYNAKSGYFAQTNLNAVV